MKLAIIGSPSTPPTFDISAQMPNPFPSIVLTGKDNRSTALISQYCITNRIPYRTLAPDFILYGRTAPQKRNKILIDTADRLLALWDGHDRLVLHAILYAEKTKKPYRVVFVKPVPLDDYLSLLKRYGIKGSEL